MVLRRSSHSITYPLCLYGAQEFTLPDLPEVPLSRLLLETLLRVHIRYVSVSWLKCSCTHMIHMNI